jgi:hypothetical protein
MRGCKLRDFSEDPLDGFTETISARFSNVFDYHYNSPTLAVSNIPNKDQTRPMNKLSCWNMPNFATSILRKVEFLSAIDAPENLHNISEMNSIVGKHIVEKCSIEQIGFLGVPYTNRGRHDKLVIKMTGQDRKKSDNT